MSFAMELLQLPQECKSSVFSFLNLNDLLNFASASKMALYDTLFALHQRQRKMLTGDFGYSTYGSRVLLVQDGDDVPMEEEEEEASDASWYPIPSVVERVAELCCRIPAEHPMSSHVHMLHQELSAVSLTTIEEQIQDLYSLRCTRLVPLFESLFTIFQKLSKPLKMCAYILNFVTSNNLVQPNDKYGNHISSSSFYSRTQQRNNTTTVSLDRYIGDVLCVTYLMNQSCPNSAIFLQQQRQQSQHCRHGTNHDEAQSLQDCYHSWVYMHGSILRTKTFTLHQTNQPGISQGCSVLAEQIPYDCSVNTTFLSSAMTLVLNDFGPLVHERGHSRVRDVVHWRNMPAQRLFALFVTSTNRNNPNNNSNNATLLNPASETQRSALEWLLLVHEQCGKSRPMTVRPPVVRLTFPRD